MIRSAVSEMLRHLNTNYPDVPDFYFWWGELVHYLRQSRFRIGLAMLSQSKKIEANTVQCTHPFKTIAEAETLGLSVANPLPIGHQSDGPI